MTTEETPLSARLFLLWTKLDEEIMHLRGLAAQIHQEFALAQKQETPQPAPKKEGE